MEEPLTALEQEVEMKPEMSLVDWSWPEQPSNHLLLSSKGPVECGWHRAVPSFSVTFGGWALFHTISLWQAGGEMRLCPVPQPIKPAPAAQWKLQLILQGACWRRSQRLLIPSEFRYLYCELWNETVLPVCPNMNEKAFLPKQTNKQKPITGALIFLLFYKIIVQAVARNIVGVFFPLKREQIFPRIKWQAL